MPNYTYFNFSVANSSEVEPRSINDSQDIVGFYTDAFGKRHGFSYENGIVKTIDVPGAESTILLDINASGEILGNSSASRSSNAGAFTDTDGSFQAIVIPGSVNLAAFSLNDAGQVTGEYTDASTEKERGFIYQNGRYTAFDANVSGAQGTAGLYINNAGEVLADYEDSSNHGRYFIYNAGSQYFIDVPGSDDGTTNVSGLNDQGQVAGTFESGGTRYGFVENNGTYSAFGIVGSTSLQVSGINDSGVVAGYYFDGSSVGHPFLERDGVVTVVDDPQHVNALFDAIDDAGDVTGYSESNHITTAFVATLTPPTIAGTVANQQTTDRNPVTPFAGVTVTDPNGTTETLTITLTGGGGTLTGAGLTAANGGGYQLTGTAAQVTQWLDALSFTPTAGAPGTTTNTTFVLTDRSSAGPSVVDSGTSVTDTTAPTPVPIAPGNGGVGGVTPADAVSLSNQVTRNGSAFTLSGTATSAAGVKGVEISAQVDGVATDLGAATVDANGNFTFKDAIGANTQGFITATETDDAGGTAAARADYSLTGGLSGGKARQDRYSADGSAVTARDVFTAKGSQTVDLKAGGQTFRSASFDVFDNHGQPSSTFVFDPGFGRDVVSLFRVDGVDHDMLSFKGSDYGNDIPEVLSAAHDTKAGLLITDPTASSAGGGPGTHDTLLLKGITKQQLAANQGDIAFHA